VSDELEVRPARPEEYDVIGELAASAYVDGGHLPPGHGYLDILRDVRGRATEAVLLVAAVDGQVLGTVTYCPHGSAWRELGADDEGEFRSLAVAPEAQGRGVGTTLVQECVRRSVADGDRGMVLSSLPDQTSAHRVYQRLGFARAPERDWHPEPGTALIAFAMRHPPEQGGAP